jgi:hypothetical protein
MRPLPGTERAVAFLVASNVRGTAATTNGHPRKAEQI